MNNILIYEAEKVHNPQNTQNMCRNGLSGQQAFSGQSYSIVGNARKTITKEESIPRLKLNRRIEDIAYKY